MNINAEFPKTKTARITIIEKGVVVYDAIVPSVMEESATFIDCKFSDFPKRIGPALPEEKRQ